MTRVVVVGAGPAGCLTARRLANAGADVELVEAGTPAEPTIDFAPGLADPDRWWQSIEGVSLAKAVGGASALNGMLASAPDHDDLADWDRSTGSAPGTALDSFRRVRSELDARPAPPGAIAAAVADAALHRGLTRGGTTLDVGAMGVLDAMLAFDGWSRRSAATVYLDGAPEGLGVSPGRRVTALRRSASGGLVVDAVDASGTRASLDADHVVLAAGALVSPRLARSVVPRLQPAPAVNHRGVGFAVPLDPARRSRGPVPSVSGVVRWSTGVVDDRADVQLVVLEHFGLSDTGRAGGLVLLTLLAVDGTGAHGSAVDRERLRAGLATVVDVLGSDPVRALLSTGSAIDLPSPGLDADGLDRWIAERPNPVHHVTGTLPLGGPVDGDGTVRSTSDLSVVDASVFPVSPRADTQVPVYVMADVLAGRLIARLGLG